MTEAVAYRTTCEEFQLRYNRLRGLMTNLGFYRGELGQDAYEWIAMIFNGLRLYTDSRGAPRARMEVDLWYPARDGTTPKEFRINEINVGLTDVRASDGIAIRYDFERDGYVILQPDNDYKYEETAFVKSWARRTETEDDDE